MAAQQKKRLRRGALSEIKTEPTEAIANVHEKIEPAACDSLQATCGICLETPKERGVLSSCDHAFCFVCIMEWAKVTNRCPLCKAKFNTVTPRAMKEGEVTSHKRKQYRILDREQRVEWEPEDGELMDDLEEEDEASNDSFVVADDDADAIWGTYHSDDDFEAHVASEDEEVSEDAEDEDDFPSHVAPPPRRTRAVPNPPSVAAAVSKPPARRRTAASTRSAVTGPRSPIRRFIVPKPAAVALVPYRPPVQRQSSKVEIETPDGRFITVRRSKHSATPLPREEIEDDIWTQFERSRKSGSRSGSGLVGSVKSSLHNSCAPAARQHKPRGAVASHALISHAMPRFSFQRADSVPTVLATPPPASRAATLPVPPALPKPPASPARKPAVVDFYVPPTPPKPLASSLSAPIVVGKILSSPQSVPQTPPRPAASPKVSSPFKGDRNERAALKRTVAERVKSMLNAAHKEGRITDEQFKSVARATTAAFVAERGEGADLRAHLRRVAQEQLGVTLGDL